MEESVSPEALKAARKVNPKGLVTQRSSHSTGGLVTSISSLSAWGLNPKSGRSGSSLPEKANRISVGGGCLGDLRSYNWRMRVFSAKLKTQGDCDQVWSAGHCDEHDTKVRHNRLSPTLRMWCCLRIGT